MTADALADRVKRAAFLVAFCQAKLKSTEEEIGKIVGQLAANNLT